MKKVFEALSIIIETLSDDKGRVMCRKELDVLMQALTELQAIKEAKPSEALRCLIGLEKEITQRDGYISDFLKIKFNTINQALLKAQKDKIIADFIREHYKLSNDINKNYLELKKPITEEEHNKFKENL